MGARRCADARANERAESGRNKQPDIESQYDNVAMVRQDFDGSRNSLPDVGTASMGTTDLTKRTRSVGVRVLVRARARR